MNFKNLAMWAIIVFLTMGLYNLFKNPQNTSSQINNITFSEFLEEFRKNQKSWEVSEKSTKIFTFLGDFLMNYFCSGGKQKKNNQIVSI